MANLQRNFILGRMNKSLDERLIPNGEYVDALNVRLGSTEDSEVGSVETTKGNTQITQLQFEDAVLSSSAKCIGAYEDGARETMYWFVTDPNFSGGGATGKLDLIVSFNTQINILTYHVISVDDGGGVNTTLNFNEQYLITGVNLVDDLLFFTDDYNPPRFINIERNYPNPVANIDQVTAEQLLVIKRPPAETVGLSVLPTSSEDNFLQDRFVCFAYRWQYADNEYSATSPFSAPAFQPGPFDYSFATSLNEGMVNIANLAQITYNSGGPLVTGIDLLWKDMQIGSIRIIEKLDKAKLGLTDNTDYTFSFSSSKIFTLLPESEILRLYDNVPRLAKAQTLMGNRLIYGNYLEQYDLIDANGFPTKLEYTLALVSNDIGLEDLETDTDNGFYTIDGSQSIPNSILTVLGVGNQDLKAGALLEFQFSFEHQTFSGDTPFPTDTNLNLELSFEYILPQDFASAYDLAISTDFIEKIGTAANIQTVANCADGTTLTDLFNCSLLNTLGSLEKIESGITGINQPFAIITSPASPDIGFQIPAMKYVDDPVTPTQEVFEYYTITQSEASFSLVGNPTSLHSDRSYEVGIIYMDEYSRATTALVSPLNSIEVPCSASDLQNQLQLTIPPTQLAPEWAKKYKFCIKADKENYFNVYSQFFFRDPITGADYFLLEGQNSRKVEEGDLLRVKQDTDGAVSRCVTTSVLEKKAQQQNFLDPPPVDTTGTELPVPAGVYAKIRANNFATQIGENPVVAYGELSDTDTGGNCSLVRYPVSILNPEYDATQPADPVTNPYWIDYTIPAGSRINIRIENERRGKSCSTSGVERRFYLLDKSYTASQDYANFRDWFNGDNIGATFNGSGVVSEADCGESPPEMIYDATLLTSTGTGAGLPAQSMFPCGLGLYSQFFEVDDAYPNAGALIFNIIGLKGYSGKKKKAKLKVEIEVVRSTSLIVWETEPQDALPDVWYEGNQTFDLVTENNICSFEFLVSSAEPYPIIFDYTDINGVPQNITVQQGKTASVAGVCGSASANASTPITQPTTIINSDPMPVGSHLGNVQNQTATDSAIIDLSFFNCYAFGNGVESYAIRDAIGARECLLGNRVFTTNSEEYKEIRRFADLTYSGVFNDETNINKLNEFNLGLLNFKPLEESYGPVYIIDGRETDILALQEDKISYVLTGKNLLSDSTGGGVISSVPEVLGTQIARIEEYGISENPESYVKYGMDKYFTDAKRGAVLQLKGSSGQNERLTVISEQGMRSYFRDLFLESFNTQKLGGFDPYMNEYVLSSNNTEIPSLDVCIECGVTRTVTVEAGQSFDFCVDVGALVGEVNIDYNILSVSDTVTIDAAYNGVNYSTGPVTDNTGSPLVVNKDSVAEDTVGINVTVPSGSATLELTVNCPDAQEITIIQVCYSLNNDAGQFIHNEYRWIDGAFISPLHSTGIELVSGTTTPLISQYDVISGPQGAGIIPADGAIVSIISNKIPPIDDYVFDPTVDELRYLRSNTLYANTPVDMAALMAASQVATPISGGPNTYEATFNMPVNNDQYLYLIYDYRRPTAIELCYDASSLSAACCDCSAENIIVQQCRQDGVVSTEIVNNSFGLVVGDFVSLQSDPDCVYEVIDTTTDDVTDTIATVRNDITNCLEVCGYYRITNTSPDTQHIFQYNDCEGTPEVIEITLGIGEIRNVCLTSFNTPVAEVTVEFISCTCPPPVRFEVTQCRFDGVSVTEVVEDTSGGGLSVGDFVSLDFYPNCSFEITSITTNPLTGPVIASQLAITDCTDTCQEYTISNSTPGSTIGFPYTDCLGVGQLVTLNAGQSEVVCASNIGTPVAGIEITFDNCQCTVNNVELTQCRADGVVNTEIMANTGVTLNDFVSVAEYPDCVFQVTSQSTLPTTVTYNSTLTVTDCNQVCQEYTFSNNQPLGGPDCVFDITNCSGVAETFNVAPQTTRNKCMLFANTGQSSDCSWTLANCNCSEEVRYQVTICDNGNVTPLNPGIIQSHVISDSTNSLSIGDFVYICGCAYQVVSVSIEGITATEWTQAAITDCNQACAIYEITTLTTGTFQYTDCDGTIVTSNLNTAGEVYEICMRTFNPAQSSASVEVKLVGCNGGTCNVEEVRIAEICNLGNTTPSLPLGTPTTIYFDNTISQLTNGDKVYVGNCAYEVGNVAGGTQLLTPVTDKQVTDCQDGCATYRITNSSSDQIASISYRDCANDPQTANVAPLGATDICVRNFTAAFPSFATVQLVGCCCSDGYEVGVGPNLCREILVEKGAINSNIIVYNCDGSTTNFGGSVNVGATRRMCIAEIIGINGTMFVTELNCNCAGDPLIVGQEPGACQYKFEATRCNAGTSYGGFSVTEIVDPICQTGIYTPKFAGPVNVNDLTIGDIVYSGNEAFRLSAVVPYSTPTTKTITNYFFDITCDDVCNTYEIANTSGSPQNVTYIDCETSAPITVAIGTSGTILVCAKEFTSLPTGVSATLNASCCSQTGGTYDLCKDYIYSNNSGSQQTLNYIDCNGDAQSETVTAGSRFRFCAGEFPTIPPGVIEVASCRCGQICEPK